MSNALATANGHVSGTQEDSTGNWSNYQRQIYGSFKAPVLSTQIHDLEALAKENLPGPNYWYAGGSAGTGATCDANVEAFKDWRIIPSMLRDANKRNLKVKLFGTEYSSPVLLGPVGVCSLFHDEAEEAVARAAGKIGMPMIMSTAATRTIEQVAAANGPNGARWYQLYWPVTEPVTLSLLKRAKENGFTVLVVTLDTTLLGYRPKDLDTSTLPFLNGQGCAVGFSDPVFLEREGMSEGVLESGDMDAIRKGSMAWLGEVNSGYFHTWEDVAFLKANWDGPIVLKGIQSVADAKKALSIGVDGIVVSNHGGRQIDGAISSLSALVKIAADPVIAASPIVLLFDSGIRTGTDVIKALALGADAVLLGRPWVWGLTLAGQGGVEHVARTILAELEVSLGLMGKKDVSELGIDDLEKVEKR